LLEAGPGYIQFREVKLHIVLFSGAFLEICCKIVEEAEYKARQSLSLIQVPMLTLLVEMLQLKRSSLLYQPLEPCGS